jgi:hypothetical protein
LLTFAPLAGGAVVFVMSDDSAPTIAARSMTPDGEALRELARFYWEHPGSRGELTDGRAPKRLADERFDAPSQPASDHKMYADHGVSRADTVSRGKLG